MRTRYFIDFEFSEGFFKPIWWLPAIGFNKKRWSIELISIGVQAEDGRRYYAINDSFRRSRCNDWVKENVLTKLPNRVLEIVQVPSLGDDTPYYFPIRNLTYKAISEIRQDLIALTQGTEPIFYGYYSDYDWVLFCTIFGTMMELPKGFPMYCIDLKQDFDNAVRSIAEKELRGLAERRRVTGNEFASQLDKVSKQLKASDNYPKQRAEVEHDALEDAKWNFELFKFLKVIQQSL